MVKRYGQDGDYTIPNNKRELKGFFQILFFYFFLAANRVIIKKRKKVWKIKLKNLRNF